MFGCLRRLGCLTLIALAVLLYFTRDSWRPLAARFRSPATAPGARGTSGGATRTTTPVWQSVDYAAATRGEQAVRALSARRGPVYVNLTPGELVSYAVLSLADGLSDRLRDAQTTIVGDRVYVRAEVSPENFPGILSRAVRDVLHQRDTLQLGGTVDVLRPELAQLRVREVRIGAIRLPSAVIPNVVARFRQGEPPADVAPDALPIPLPPYIGDVRVARDHITLYKTLPQPPQATP